MDAVLYWRLLDFVPVNSQRLLAEANLLASTLICSLDVNMKRRRCSMENKKQQSLCPELYRELYRRLV
jgi:hypothetical protein